MDTMTLAGTLADRDSWDNDRCPMVRALAIVGTRSAMLLLREACYGTRRFDQLARLAGISEPVAAARLAELVEEGLLVRRPYREPGQRTRYEYELTEKGRDFAEILFALRQWGNRWVLKEEARTELAHASCGEPVTVQFRCAEGHRVDVGDVEVRRTDT
jgi:DNA-binding HxlR family transcriptional regulator